MNETNEPEDDCPWLRDLVDEDLLPLFSEDESVLKRAVRTLIPLVRDDDAAEERIIELLDLAIEHGSDDTSASLLAAIILGEARSLRGLPVLLRALAYDADETLQDASGVALLRIGAPALEALMEAMEETDDPGLNRPAYGVLGRAGILGDEALRTRVMDFLEARIELERRKGPRDSAIEQLFQASSALGDRRQIERMRTVIQEDHGGRQTAIQDAMEILEENTESVPFVTTVLPWEERYGWLFEDDREEARVVRNRAGQIAIQLPGMEEAGDEADDGAGDGEEDEDGDPIR